MVVGEKIEQVGFAVVAPRIRRVGRKQIRRQPRQAAVLRGELLQRQRADARIGETKPAGR